MILGIDLHDTGVSAVIASDDGEIVARERRDGPALEAAAEAIGALRPHAPARIGAAVADPTDPQAAAQVAAIADRAGVTSATGVTIVSTGSAVALGEQWRGAARGFGTVVALYAGSRVDAGIVLNGALFEGAHRRAGAASWLAVNPAEREDYRKYGCFEAEAGAGGIVRRFIWRVKAGDFSRAADASDLSSLTVERILDAARAGDGVAISVVRDTTKYLGMTIGNIVSLLDPEIVVLAGLYARAADLLVEQARTEVARRVSPRPDGVIPIVSATLGDDAVAVGAARAALTTP